MACNIGPSPHSTTPPFFFRPLTPEASLVLQPQPPPEQSSALLSPYSPHLLTPLQPHWLARCCSEDTNTLLPQGHCTGFSLCLRCSSLRSPQSQLLLIIYMSFRHLALCHLPDHHIL